MEEIKLIEVKEDILSDNKIHADELRAQLKSDKTFLMNLMSSPGAGKTTFISQTIENDIRQSVGLNPLPIDDLSLETEPADE